MYPRSYRPWATDMVRPALKRSLLPASCCIVVVHGEAGVREPAHERTRVGLVQMHRRGVGREHPGGGVEVARARDPLAVELHESRTELRAARREATVEVPELRATERHALALALHDEPDRAPPHPPGGAGAPDAPPEHGRHLVADETIECPPTLLRLDESHVELTRVRDRAVD